MNAFKAPKAAQPAASVKEPEPVRIPSIDDPDVVQAARRQTMADQKKRRGRASTALASDVQTPYQRTALG